VDARVVGGHDDADPEATIRTRAAAIGLPLTDAEVRAQVVGVARLAAMAAEVRALIVPGVEPSGPAVGTWREPQP
jgi:hypothetical protein